MVLLVINLISQNIIKVMLVINPTSSTKTSMEFKTITTTFKDFLNNNSIERENFLGDQLNYERRKRKECFDDTHRQQT
jgi:predicted NUDIX family phosphoesterase